MKTKIRTIDKTKLHSEESRKIIAEAGEILKQGGLVAFPTETVYGLGADAFNSQAARKIYEAKGRPSDNPLIVHIADLEDLTAAAKAVPEVAYRIAERYWPGPLTMVFEKTEAVPCGTTGGLDTVAVRMPEEEISREVIRAGGGFIAAPSANTSGRPSPTEASHVIEDLQGKVDMIIDGGATAIGVESTVLDMTVTPPMILRPGAVTKEMLEAVIGEVREDKTLLSADAEEKPKAPGMKYRHYAPKGKLIVVKGSEERVADVINRMAKQHISEGASVGVIATEETVSCYEAGIVKCIGTRTDEQTIASHLFGILREFDHENVHYIYSEAFEAAGIGSAIMNRLLKAAGYHVIQA